MLCSATVARVKAIFLTRRQATKTISYNNVKSYTFDSAHLFASFCLNCQATFKNIHYFLCHEFQFMSQFVGLQGQLNFWIQTLLSRKKYIKKYGLLRLSNHIGFSLKGCFFVHTLNTSVTVRISCGKNMQLFPIYYVLIGPGTNCGIV